MWSTVWASRRLITAGSTGKSPLALCFPRLDLAFRPPPLPSSLAEPRTPFSNAPRGRHAYRSVILSPVCCRLVVTLVPAGASSRLRVSLRPDQTRPDPSSDRLHERVQFHSFKHSFIPYTVAPLTPPGCAPGLSLLLSNFQGWGLDPRSWRASATAPQTPGGDTGSDVLAPQTHEAPPIFAPHRGRHLASKTN